MSVTLARRPRGPVERPDNPDGGPGLPQNGDGFEKGLCTCFFSHLSTHGRKVSFLNIGGWSQVTPTGDSIRDLCLPEPWICLLMRMSPAPGPRERRPRPLLWPGRHGAKLGFDWGPSACCTGQESAVTRWREALRVTRRAGRSGQLPCGTVISAPCTAPL